MSTPDTLRNIALVGHSSTGKTSIAEAILFRAGITNRLGTVQDGTTKSDFTLAEINRGISIAASFLHCSWKNTRLNIVDTPGYSDFIGDAKAALWATDNAVVLVDAASGVEVGTDKVWGFAEEYGRPAMLVMNHLDKDFADFEGVLAALQEHFGQGVVPFHLPVNPGSGFNQIVDVYKQKLLTYPADGSGVPVSGEVPAELQERVASLREQIVEAAAESEDELTEKYLEEGELSEAEIHAGLRTGILNRSLFPLLVSDAAHNIGADLLLDFVVENVPSPANMSAATATDPGSGDAVELSADAEGPLAASVFKTISENVGDLSFVRVVSGTLKTGADVYNSSREKSERIGQIYLTNGKDREDISELVAGDIGALVKLKDTHTGNTICERNRQLIVPPIEFPHPLIRIAVQPHARGDEEKIGTGLNRIHEEDPSFLSGYDPELKQIIVQGQGELHLTVVLEKLKEKFGVEVDIIEPRIPYRETITSKSEGHYRHRKQTGGRGQFGEVYLRVEPLPRGSGFEFDNAVVGGSIPGKFLPAAEKGIIEALERGVVAGYTVVDVKVTVYDGSYHAVDSSEMAFKLAGSHAFQEAFKASKPILLEPIYHLQIRVPENYVGDVMGDLNSRRGRIQGIDPEGSFQLVKADVPLGELYKYSTALRSMTHGAGDYTMQLSHYDQVPQEVMSKIIESSDLVEEVAA